MWLCGPLRGVWAEVGAAPGDGEDQSFGAEDLDGVQDRVPADVLLLLESAALSTPDAPVPVRRSWSAGRMSLSSGIRSGRQWPSWGNGSSMRFLSAMTGDSRRLRPADGETFQPRVTHARCRAGPARRASR
jgi:hypothetical protein